MEGGFAIMPAEKAGLDLSDYINAIDEPKDITKQIALIDQTNMGPAEKVEAKKAAT